MYLSVMWLQRPNRGPWGINIHVYWHPNGLPDDPWKVVAETGPDDRPRRQIELAPGGNRVMAYLDVVLEDAHYTPALVEAALAEMGQTIAGGAPNPVRGFADRDGHRVHLRFGMGNQWADREGMMDDYALLRGALLPYLRDRVPQLPGEFERSATRQARRAVR